MKGAGTRSSKTLELWLSLLRLGRQCSILEDKTIPVYKGRARSVKVAAQVPLLTIPRGIQTGLDVSLQTKQLIAPVEKGQVVGTLTVRYDGQILKQTSLLAADEVARGGLWRVFIDSISLFFRGLIRRP